MEGSTLYSIFKDGSISLALPIFINVHSRLSIVQMRKNEITYEDILECLQITRNFDDGFKQEELNFYAGTIYEAVTKTKFTVNGPRLIMKKELIGNDENYFKEILKVLIENLLKTIPKDYLGDNKSVGDSKSVVSVTQSTDEEKEIPEKVSIEDENKINESDNPKDEPEAKDGEEREEKDEAPPTEIAGKVEKKEPEIPQDPIQLRASSLIQSLKKDMEKFLSKPLSLQFNAEPIAPISFTTVPKEVKIVPSMPSVPVAQNLPVVSPAASLPQPTNDFNYNNYPVGNTSSYSSGTSLPMKDNYPRQPAPSQWEVLQNDFGRSGFMSGSHEDLSNSYHFQQNSVNRSSVDPSYYNSSRPMMTKPSVSAQQFQQQQLLQQQFQQQLSASANAIEKNEGMIKFLAYVRKGGMDILFPQLLHDKLLLIIYAAVKSTPKLAHRELMDMVTLVREFQMITGLDHVSKTKIRGVFALLKTCLSLDTLPGQGDAVRLLIGKGISNFKEFRERHDTFINRVLLQQHIFLPLNLKAELFWILSPEKLSERLLELQQIEDALVEFFLNGEGNVRRLNTSGLAPVDTNDFDALVDSPILPPQSAPDTFTANLSANNVALPESSMNSYADYLQTRSLAAEQSNNNYSDYLQGRTSSQSSNNYSDYLQGRSSTQQPAGQQRFPGSSMQNSKANNSQQSFPSSIPNFSTSPQMSSNKTANSYHQGLSNFPENKGLQQQPLSLSSYSSSQYQNKSQPYYNKSTYSTSSFGQMATDYNNPFESQLSERDNTTNNNNLNLFYSSDGEKLQPNSSFPYNTHGSANPSSPSNPLTNNSIPHWNTDNNNSTNFQPPF